MGKAAAITDEILKRIRTGVYRDRIPGERALAAEFSVNFKTANRAVGALVDRGLLVRRRGEGTFLKDRARTRSGNIACVVKALKQEPSSYYLEMFRGIEEAVSARGINLVFASMPDDDDPECAPLGMVREGRVDGMILVEFRRDDLVAKLREAGAPVVLLDSEGEIPEVDCVMVDDRQAARTATAHLLGLGHRRIGFVTGDERLAFYVDRAAGYREALEAAGVEYNEDLVCWGGPWFGKGLAQIKRMMAEGMTAIAGASDCLVDGALEVLRRLGVRSPEDMSAVGLGGSPALPESFLSTVRIDWVEMGRQAGRVLLERIDGSSAPWKYVRVPGELLERRSCARMSAAAG